MANIVVLGAGVSGLTSALLLAKKKNTVTVVAKHMPGDYDIEYISPWAGANVLPMAEEADSRWERRTWPVLRRLATESPAAGIHLQKARVLARDRDVVASPGTRSSDALFDESPWYATMFDDYQVLDKGELPAGVRHGCQFTSVCINTALYLPWLVSQCLAYGVVFRRAVLEHITEAADMSYAASPVGDASDGGGKADVIINASGLLASKLGGVADPAVYPVRGQTVLVRNEIPYMLSTSSTDDGSEEITYTMMRAAGGGTILGGTYAKNNWDPNPDPNIAVRIMKRAVEAQPQLTNGKGVEGLSIIRHGVGLRPVREGGVRIEKEVIDGQWVVHNYGHGAWGYQGSYGCAERVVELVEEIVQAK